MAMNLYLIVNEFIPHYSEPGNKSGEFKFLKLRNCNGHRKTVILGNVYRSPAASNKPEKFNNLFDKILQKLNTNRYSIKTKYIVGDTNQDLIKYDSEIGCQNLVDNAHNNDFVQIVSRPTRITEHSKTLIEHVRSRYERKYPKRWILPWLEIACARKIFIS